jgi:hypothetical protein
MTTEAFRSQVTVTEYPMPEIPEPSSRDGTTLFKLRAQQCRYVVSDETEAIFCGAPTDDDPAGARGIDGWSTPSQLPVV